MSAIPIPSLVARYAAAAAGPVRARMPVVAGVAGLDARLQALEAAAHRWLIAYSIVILRVSLGAVFLGFGFLKFFPGVSPAQDLVERTTDILTLGLVPGSVAIVGVAALECVIGLCLVAGRGMRGAIYLLMVQLVGILSPVVLLAGRMFDGPHGAPTLEGQYVLKDVVLVGAALVLAATLRGGRLTSDATQDDAR
jgi:putative oxidoreductase